MNVSDTLRYNPKILYRIVKHPLLATHGSSTTEHDAFENIRKMAYPQKVYASASESRKRTFRNHLSKDHKEAIRQEKWVQRNTVLTGAAAYSEIGYRMSRNRDYNIPVESVMGLLEEASEILWALENG